MRGHTRAVAAVAGVGVAAVLLAACGGGGSTSGSKSNASSEISIGACTVQSPLLPGDTNEVCGGTVLNNTTAKLVRYNPDTSQPENDIAQSITTKDNQHFDVKIKPTYKFSDGTSVKASNFVDAWNWAADCKNGQANSYFYTPIKGYADLQTDGGACKTAPKTDKMSGLKVISDTEFTITTTEKVSNLPVRLGYVAFAPLPDSFFKSAANQKAQEKIPVGAGPFKVVSNNTTDIVLQKNPYYAGPYKPHVDKVDFRVYKDPSAAFNDVLANNLDFTGTMDPIPNDQLINNQWQKELAGRWGQKGSSVFGYITFSPIDKQLTGASGLKLREAISMSINRPLIIKQVFANSYSPASGWVSPVVEGYKAGACGENCTYNPAKAKQLFKESNGYKGTLTLTYNADGGHKAWCEAVASEVSQNLGIKVVAKPLPDFKTLLDSLDKKEISGMFRNGWVMDYPSIEDYLAPIYGTGADSNYAGYSNKAFDKQLQVAASADTGAPADAAYQKAEQILGKDFPTAPLWFEKTNYAWSNNVTDIKVDAFQQLDLSSIQLKKS
ncbi:peptide ABC transporter substrate-binding protein [Microlunatus endophyticus]|uniref:Peptide ABC transporter substrate-binding protein n=1 Tax=Microlunatus endophyticus TaxID=1716077 RepID=A0A917S100_9ACTN|nr:ABC transporter substrate-binding protein [Microlunatus endophyticus]GGL47385.1 peptide ABC transporter substrate-binding protein [Microlunatus endophyticus]